MKTWRKTFAAAIAVILIVLVCTYFLVKSVLLPETIRLIIIPRLEEIAQQTISCREIKVSPGGTITLKDIVIGEEGQPVEHGLLVRARDVLLQCRILPLLSKKIIIERISLREPYFRLVRNEAGAFNFASSKGSNPGLPKSGNPERTRLKSEPSLSLNIRSLAFQNGTLVFTDHFKRTPQPVETTVKDMNGRFSDLSPVSPFYLQMTGEIVSTSPSVLRLKATIDPLRKVVTSDVKLTPFDISCFAPYLPTLPFSLRKGYCALDLTVVVNRSLGFSSQGLLRLTDVDISTEDVTDTRVPEALAEIIRNSDISLDHDLTYRSGDDTLLMEKCAVEIGTIAVSLKGTVTDCRTAPRCNITLDADRVSAANLFSAVPSSRLPAIGNLSTSGEMKAHFTLTGDVQEPDDMNVNGSLLMDKVSMQSDVPLRWKFQVDGRAALKNQDVLFDQLTARTGDSLLALNGEIKNCFSDAPAASLRMSSPSIDVEEVKNSIEALRTLKMTFKDDEEKEGGQRKNKGRGDYKDVKVNAEMDIDRLAYRNLVLSDVEARSHLSGNRFVVESVRGVMGDGAFSASGRMGWDGEILDCICYFTGNRLQIAPLLQALAPGRTEEVSGAADLVLNMQGQGASSGAFKQNLTGEGNFTIRDGKISNLKSLESIASFIKIDALKTLAFDESRGTFTIGDGAIRLESSLKGKEVELYPAGTIGLDSALDIALDMRLAPQLSDQIADGVLTKYFKDQQGWTVLSLAIKSPPGGDVVVLPASSTIKNITEMLADILLKKEAAPGEEGGDKKKALEGLLQKLMQKSKEAGAGEEVNQLPQ